MPTPWLNSLDRLVKAKASSSNCFAADLTELQNTAEWAVYGAGPWNAGIVDVRYSNRDWERVDKILTSISEGSTLGRKLE